MTTTTFTGTPIDPACRAAVEATASVLERLGHRIVEARPAADTPAMMQAWTRIVACGTAQYVRARLQRLGRQLRPDDVEGVTRGAIAYASTVSGADYLEAVGVIHAYGREMAAFFEPHDMLLSATLAEPPALVGRFCHDSEDYAAFRLGPGGVFDYSPFCAAFNASGQPAVSLPLGWSPDGLPIGVHIAARFGADELLMALSAELEDACPWAERRPPVAAMSS